MLALVLAASLALTPAEPIATTLGPPGLCFPFEQPEGAPQLPFGEGAFAPLPDYDRGNLVVDTLAILRSNDDPFVHAETLRRAVIYIGGASGGQDDSSVESRRTLTRALGAQVAWELSSYRDGVKSGRVVADDRREALLALDLGFFQGASEQFGWALFDDTRELLVQAMQLQPDDPALLMAAAAGGFEAFERAEFEQWLQHILLLTEDRGGPARGHLLKVGKAFYGTDSVADLREHLQREHRR